MKTDLKPYVLLAAGLFLLTIYGFLARDLWQSHRYLTRTAQQELTDLADTLASQTAFALSATDMLLSGLVESLQLRPDLLRAGNPQGQALLARRLSSRPSATDPADPADPDHEPNLVVYDARGRPYFDALGRMTSDLDLSDRTYFRVQRDNPAQGLYLDRPITSRISGRPIIPLSRRLENPDGTFAGVVAGAIYPDYLVGLYRQTLHTTGGSVLLKGGDGIALVTVGPDDEWPLTDDIAGQELQSLTGPGGQTYWATVRPVPGFDLQLTATQPREAALAPLWPQVYRDLVIALIVTLAVGLLAWLVLRQMGQRVQASRLARLQATILEQITDAVVVTDPQGLIIDWNRAAERLFGYSRAEALGRPPRFMYPTPEAEALDRRIQQQMVEQGNWRGERTLWSKDGREVQCDTVIVPLLDEQGRVGAWVGINRDIRGRKRAEAQLRESEARLRIILDNLVDSVITIDEQGTICWANRATETTFGYRGLELVGRNINILMPEPYHSEHDAYLRHYRETGEARIIGIGREAEGRRHNGETFPLDLSVSEVRMGDERLFTGVVRDITERKRMERLKDEFVSTVSHELRTPLTSIRGSLGLVVGGLGGELPAKAASLIRIAHKNSERLVSLVNDILDIQKIESGHMEFSLQPLELNGLLEQAIAENRSYAGQFGVELNLRTGRLVQVYADSARLLQVLANLLSNAVKFSPQGAQVDLTLEHRAGMARVAVVDRGSGIPESFRGRIFEKFAQADSSTTRAMGGTGLGLSISRAIVERHGGQIGFATEEGRGTTFWFELPEYQVSAPAGKTSEARPRLLVCEDEPATARLMKLLLEEQGYRVDIVASALEARQYLKDNGYVAMTLDLMLPDQNGIQFIRRLREDGQHRHLPVVVVSAHADQERVNLDGEALGVVDWLIKPFDHQRLVEAIRHATYQSQRPWILHVEDDEDLIRVVGTLLEEMADVDPASTVAEAREQLSRRRYDLVLLDIGLPDGSGLSLLADIQDQEPPPSVLIFSAQDQDRQVLAEVSAALVKSRTANHQLIDTIKALVRARTDRHSIQEAVSESATAEDSLS